jgi:hypothetical protein
VTVLLHLIKTQVIKLDDAPVIGPAQSTRPRRPHNNRHHTFLYRALCSASTLPSMAPADDQPVATQESRPDAPSGPADESTPLLGREAAEPSTGTAGVSRVSLSENIKRWRRQRWISLLIAFILVTAIVILTLVFGGW